MIDWKTIQSLHVNKKLQQIISKWFDVDIFYTDEFGKVQNKLFDKGYSFKCHFFKELMSLPHGGDILKQDIEKSLEFFSNEKEAKIHHFESFFPGVYLLGSRVMYEGEMKGVVYSYGVVKDSFTSKDSKKAVEKLVECGAVKEDAQMAVDKLKRLSETDKEYFSELVDLVAEEVSSFHGEISKREERIQDLNSELGNKYRYHNLIGKSKKMQEVYNLLSKIAKSEASILIQGENGTGKELVGKAIHYNSKRKDNVFMEVNCSAFNDNLLDSELFGHVKGAFTGAIKDKKGVFEVANGGTLFLDEIGDTSLTMQVKLLRVLQEGTFIPVGGTTPKKVNVRIIAATNKVLKDMIAKEEFREDLYYRINVINVALPPLRDRGDDISILADFFLEKKSAELGYATKHLSKRALEKVLDYKWPGNVRELQNEMERLVVLAGDDKTLNPDILSQRILDSLDGPRPTGPLKSIDTSGGLKNALEELEIMMIREGLRRCNFNKSKLAKELGISRAGLIMKVDKYELDKRKKAA